MSISANNYYFPTLLGDYVSPKLTPEERKDQKQAKLRQLDAALMFLADFNHPVKLKKRCCPLPICNNAPWNLGVYMCSRPLAIIMRAFLCCFDCEDESKKPIPQEAAETLKHTAVQFERNTCGVCCIAPLVIIGTPFIPAGHLAAKLLEILSGLVITTTAGTNTYVFSGDIGVVGNGQGDLIIQGGIRVDAITAVKNAYIQLTNHLDESWREGNSEQRQELGRMCIKIQENWDDIFNAIVLCGIKESVVKEILAPFSLKLISILDIMQPLKLREVEHLLPDDKSV